MESRDDLAPARRARAAFYTAETERRLLRQRHRSGGIQTVIVTTRLAARATRISPSMDSYSLIGIPGMGNSEWPVLCAV
jgi:hypothetical protein